MFKSNYLQKVYDELALKNAHELEFLQAVEEFFESLDLIVDDNPDIKKNAIIERLVEPERMIMFRVSWVDDKGNVQVNRGYRCQFNSAIGPYKGGCRFHKTVNQSIIKFLAFEQIFKNSLTTLPMGGAKGGSDFDPHGKSDGEIMRFCQSFISELYRHIGADIDIPAGDIGVGAREIGYMNGYYRKIKNRWDASFTGKGIEYGGSLARPEATGYGLCYFVSQMLQHLRKDSFQNKKVIISGKGNVAIYSLQKAVELGAKVIAMSDSKGSVYDENGIDFVTMKRISDKSGSIEEYLQFFPNAKYYPNCEKIWEIKCDIALPCATQGELELKSAKKLVENGCFLVAEGANMPTTLEATKYLLEHNVLFGPGKAANAGGVATSGIEMIQNSMHNSWSFNEVDTKLKEIMNKIFDECYQMSIQVNKKGNLVVGANLAGFMKVYKAMLAQGII